MADLEQSLAELESVKQAFKTNIDATNISTSGVEFRNMPNLVKQMEKKLPSQTKTVDPTTSSQSVSADAGYKLTTVNINAVKPSDYYKPEESITIQPKTTPQVINPPLDHVFNLINVSAVTSDIDSNIQEENIKDGVTILGKTGTLKATSGSPKFAELVEGSITTIEGSDLADVTTIRDDVFANLEITKVEIPSNVTEIGDSAFANNEISSLTLNEGIQTIGASAFANNPITTLTIPSTVTSIGISAFGGTQVTELDMSNVHTPPTVDATSFPSTLTAIHVAYGDYDAYLTAWSDYADKIVRLPAIPSTITVTVNNYLGETVSGASVTITGNEQTYTGTTNENGVFSQGDLQPVTYTISVADLEGFKTPDVQEVVVEEDTQNSVMFTYLEKPASTVLGVSWVNDASTTMTRTDDAVNMAYSINSSTGKVTSDFDNVFPYNQMRRQVIDGNTFVYVPAMWFRVIADSDQKITSVAVSETKGDGDNWYQTKPFYYGAYGASSSGSTLMSVSGKSRVYSITRSVARTRATGVGANYHQRDLYTGTILMFLWWIEFADKNSQNIMTGCQYNTQTGNTDIIYNETEGENFCVSGYHTSTSQMMWHGIEDYIGNGWEWEDGITGNGTSGGLQYVSDDYTLYDDYYSGSKMSALSYSSPTTNGNCLEALGWDEEKPFLCQPIATRNDGVFTTGFCDFASTDNNTVCCRGVYSSTNKTQGVSRFYRCSKDTKDASIGCRLMKEAISEPDVPSEPDTPTFSRTFSENTPAQISAVSAEIEANNFTEAQIEEIYGWKIGDTISLNVSGVSREMRIVDFLHDEKEDGTKAGITLDMTTQLPTGYALHSSNQYPGWSSCSLRTTTLPNIKATISQEWQDVMKKVKKTSVGLYSAEVAYVYDDLFLMSAKEVGGSSGVSFAKLGDFEGSQYKYYKNNSWQKGNQSWTLRSFSSSGENYAVIVGSGGNIAGLQGYVKTAMGVSIAFCI